MLSGQLLLQYKTPHLTVLHFHPAYNSVNTGKHTKRCIPSTQGTGCAQVQSTAIFDHVVQLSEEIPTQSGQMLTTQDETGNVPVALRTDVWINSNDTPENV